MEIIKQTEQTKYVATIGLSEFEIEQAIKEYIFRNQEQLEMKVRQTGLKLNSLAIRYETTNDNKVLGSTVILTFSKEGITDEG